MRAIFLYIIYFALYAACDAKHLPQNYASDQNHNIAKIKNIRGGNGDNSLSTLDWRYFLAGGLCAATSHGLTTPIGYI